jgi:hypothetical protein
MRGKRKKGATKFRSALKAESQLELDHNARRKPAIILAASEKTCVDPVALNDAPVNRSAQFRINSGTQRSRKGRITANPIHVLV